MISPIRDIASLILNNATKNSNAQCNLLTRFKCTFNHFPPHFHAEPTCPARSPSTHFPHP